MLLFPPSYPLLGEKILCSKKKTSSFTVDIPQAYLVRAAKEINGLTRAVLTQGKYLALLPEPFRPGPDNELSIQTEKYELSEGSISSAFRAVPAISLEELQQSEDACLSLCEKVSSRLQNWLLAEVLDARDNFDNVHAKITELSTEYFGKHSDVLHAAILGMRQGKDTGNGACAVHFGTLEQLHSHTAAIRTLSTAMETFRLHMMTHNAELGRM